MKSKFLDGDWWKPVAYILFLIIVFGGIIGIRMLIVKDHPECFWAQDVGTCMAIIENGSP